MKEKQEPQKKIMIDPSKWKVIVDFIAGLNIPITQSLAGYNVVQAINSAKECNVEPESL